MHDYAKLDSDLNSNALTTNDLQNTRNFCARKALITSFFFLLAIQTFKNHFIAGLLYISGISSYVKQK